MTTTRDDVIGATAPPQQFLTSFYGGTDIYGNHYPHLPAATTVPTAKEDGCLPVQASHRQVKIINDKNYLDAERIHRKTLKDKYRKAGKVVFGTECVLIATELALTTAAVLCPPIALMTGLAAGLGLTTLNVFCRHGSKALERKAAKHSDVELLAKSKLDSIDEKYQNAIRDGVVDDKEYNDIYTEKLKYDRMKDTILDKYKHGSKTTEIAHDLKQSLIDQGKTLATEEIKTNLKKNLNM